MEIVFMIFMTFVSVVALFAVMVVIRDVVRESYATKRINAAAEREREAAMREAILADLSKVDKTLDKADAPAPVPMPQAEPEAIAPVETPLSEEVKEVSAVIVAPTEEADEETEGEADEETEEGTVSFAASARQTLEEKYEELSAEQKGFYDEITQYAAEKEDSRRFKNLRYEEYKIGSKRIVRLRIKRGVVYCEFMLTNSDFRNYISENKIPVRQSATVIKVLDTATVGAVKNSIDIAVQSIQDEKAYKKQLAREKRKQAREQNKA